MIKTREKNIVIDNLKDLQRIYRVRDLVPVIFVDFEKLFAKHLGIEI